MPSEGLSAQDFAKLKSAIDEAAIVAITDRMGNITYVNKKFCSISKFNKEELLGQNHRIINSGYHGPEFFKNMWTEIGAGRVWEGEIKNRAKDGSYYWVHTTIVPFLNESGTPVQYVSVRFEITERKQAEEQLQVYASRLETSNRELQDFASVAAHDLQEPLRKIQSFIDRIRIKAPANLNGDFNEYLERITDAASRMQTLINDLLAYSRVSTKTQKFQMVDLNQTLAQVINTLEVRTEEAKAKIQISDLPGVFADPLQMYQLFLNLVSNAIKFRKAETAPLIEVSASKLANSNLGRPGPAYEIRVKDNGIGFDEKYLDRIFTIFQRLHGRHEYEGTGIGLAICRKILDRHAGKLTASSAPSKGATFIITLPEGSPNESQ